MMRNDLTMKSKHESSELVERIANLSKLLADAEAKIAKITDGFIHADATAKKLELEIFGYKENL